MSLEETLRQIVREELAQRDERLARRLEEIMRSNIKSSDRLLGKNDDLFGYSWETVKHWMHDGKLKRYGTTKRARVSERELREFLASREQVGKLTDAKIHDMALERANRR